MKTGKIGLTALLLGAGAVAMAQPAPPPGDQPGPPPRRGMQMRGPQAGPMGPGMMQPGPRPFEDRLLPGPHGKWWDNPQVAEQLSLSADQKKKMDDIFQQHRMKLVDLHAAVEKAEITMEPLVAADQPDEAKIAAQIDKVAQARAELEKANARMLLAIRGVLTPEQYQKLQARPHAGGWAQPAQGAPPAPPAPRKQ